MEAEQVLRAVRSRILKRIPFISPVLDVVEWREQKEIKGMGTDGRSLLYCRAYVCQEAEGGRSGQLEREYLHAVCHIICRHPSQCPLDKVDGRLFGICADLKAWELHARFLESAAGRQQEKAERELQWPYRYWIERAGAEGVWLRKFYLDVRGNEGLRARIEDMEQRVRLDDHSFWRPDSAQPDSTPSDASARQWNARLERALEAMQIMAGVRVSRLLFGGPDSRRLGVACYYEAAAENHRSYREFLEEYLAREEICREDDSEIDYIWYTYSMDHWGNIPLIESPEVTEQPVLRQIAIAIDTSGSCQGELISLFLRETSNILRTYEHMEFDIMIFQADSAVCREDRITGLAQLDRYLAEGRVNGGGGTDFIPVIRRMEELNRSGRREPFRLLIYLSDGMGRFPEQKPDFDVAFALAGDCRQYGVQLPEWVIPLTITRDEARDEKTAAAAARQNTVRTGASDFKGTEGGNSLGICGIS